MVRAGSQSRPLSMVVKNCVLLDKGRGGQKGENKVSYHVKAVVEVAGGIIWSYKRRCHSAGYFSSKSEPNQKSTSAFLNLSLLAVFTLINDEEVLSSASFLSTLAEVSKLLVLHESAINRLFFPY